MIRPWKSYTHPEGAKNSYKVLNVISFLLNSFVSDKKLETLLEDFEDVTA